MDMHGGWIGVGLLACGAVACALLVQLAKPSRSSVPAAGWAMLGGVIAGILVGPTILGRLAPAQYERWYLGGSAERQQREQIIRQHQADVLAATHAQSDQRQLESLNADYDGHLTGATQVWRAAQWKHQALLRALTLFIAACVFFYGGSHSIQKRDRRQGILSPLTIGFWAAALPGGLAYVAMTALWDFAPAQAALIAAALAIGPWMLAPMDRDAADAAEHGGARMIQSAGRVASALAIVAAMWGLWMQRGAEGLLIGAALLVFPLAWLVRSPLHGVKSLVHLVCLPLLGAATTVKIELFEDFAFWPLVVILLISDDGRGLGAFCGAMLPGGRRTLRTLRLVIGSVSAGATQLALIAIAAHAWAVPRQVVLPAVLGSLIIEFAAGSRHKLVQRITQVEEEVSASGDHG
jgi:hypothetical protein